MPGMGAQYVRYTEWINVTGLLFWLLSFQQMLNSSTISPVFHNESLSETSTVHAHHETSGHPLNANPVLQWFFVICLALQSFFGTIGNLLVRMPWRCIPLHRKICFHKQINIMSPEKRSFFPVTREHTVQNRKAFFTKVEGKFSAPRKHYYTLFLYN